MKNTKQIIVTLLCYMLHAAGIAQGLPAIFKETPRHILPAKTIAAFPKKTFLENLILLPDGSILANSHYEGVVYRIDLKGAVTKYASLQGKVTGIAAYNDRSFILTGNNEKDKAVIYVLKKGKLELLLDLPQAIFVNGITRLSGEIFLAADSYKGCIWKIDVKNKKASIWLASELLERSTAQNPTPAANGIKVYKGFVYVSNTQKQLLVRIPLKGEEPGKPEIWMDRVNIDDFIFDNAGNIYGATHVYNSVIKITPEKRVIVVAEQPQGVSGSTACALKGNTLIISTNGGMYLPPPTGIEKSKIVALNIQ